MPCRVSPCPQECLGPWPVSRRLRRPARTHLLSYWSPWDPRLLPALPVGPSHRWQASPRYTSYVNTSTPQVIQTLTLYLRSRVPPVGRANGEGAAAVDLLAVCL